MKQKRLTFILTVLLSMVELSALAQGPNNSGTYYQDANGKSGAKLKTALCTIINPHTAVSYDGLLAEFEKTDLRPDGKIWEIYSDITNYTFSPDQPGSYKKRVISIIVDTSDYRSKDNFKF